MIRGFVSDLDGVVVNSENIAYEVLRKYAAELGYVLTERDYSKFIGKKRSESERIAREELGIPFNRDYSAEIGRRLLIAYEDVRLNDGYIQLLDLLSSRRIRIALASISSETLIEKKLQTVGLMQRFEAIVSAQETGNKVVAYLQAVKAIDLLPKDCFALEDSPSGARAAKDAGLYCVVVPNRFQSDSDFTVADEVHSSIPEFLSNGQILRRI